MNKIIRFITIITSINTLLFSCGVRPTLTPDPVTLDKSDQLEQSQSSDDDITEHEQSTPLDVVLPPLNLDTRFFTNSGFSVDLASVIDVPDYSRPMFFATKTIGVQDYDQLKQDVSIQLQSQSYLDDSNITDTYSQACYLISFWCRMLLIDNNDDDTLNDTINQIAITQNFDQLVGDTLINHVSIDVMMSLDNNVSLTADIYSIPHPTNPDEYWEFILVGDAQLRNTHSDIVASFINSFIDDVHLIELDQESGLAKFQTISFSSLCNLDYVENAVLPYYPQLISIPVDTVAIAVENPDIASNVFITVEWLKLYQPYLLSSAGQILDINGNTFHVYTTNVNVVDDQDNISEKTLVYQIRHVSPEYSQFNTVIDIGNIMRSPSILENTTLSTNDYNVISNFTNDLLNSFNFELSPYALELYDNATLSDLQNDEALALALQNKIQRSIELNTNQGFTVSYDPTICFTEYPDSNLLQEELIGLRVSTFISKPLITFSTALDTSDLNATEYLKQIWKNSQDLDPFTLRDLDAFVPDTIKTTTTEIVNERTIVTIHETIPAEEMQRFNEILLGDLYDDTKNELPLSYATSYYLTEDKLCIATSYLEYEIVDTNIVSEMNYMLGYMSIH